MVPKKKRAVNPSNQAALDRLIVRRAAVTTGGKSGHLSSLVWDKAVASLAAAPTEITTHAEALALPYIGHAMATHLLGRRPTPKEPPTAGTEPSAPRRTTAGQKLPSKRPLPKSSNNKERNYEKAVAASENWKTLAASAAAATHNAHGHQQRHLTWRVVLLIDCRERKSEHVQAKCQMSGIPCEERQLPIGDMAWIAQGLVMDDDSGDDDDGNDTDTNNHTAQDVGTTKRSGGTSDSNSNNNNNNTYYNRRVVVVELMLGTIIERKTPDDLKSSLFGTRYMEQRLRLQHCGLPQVLFLIEGDIHKPVFGCTFETLHTAVWETRLHLGFGIVHTAHMADTVTTLKRMHRRILQRTFPRAFDRNATEALPIYSESTMSVDERRRSVEEEGRRRRRRRQSLAEMTFDMDPIPPLGMERFISYQELKAKVELDRHSGTRTIGNIHMAMLKQVQSLDVKKCTSVVEHFPTMQTLLHAFGTAPTQTKTRISLLPTQSKTVGNRTIGTNSAEHVRIAYSVYEPNPFRTAEPDDGDGKPPPPTGVVMTVDNVIPSVLAAIAAATRTTTSSSILQPSSTINVASMEETIPKSHAMTLTETHPKPPGKTNHSNRAGQNDFLEPEPESVSTSFWMDDADMVEWHADDAKTNLSPPRKKRLKTSLGSILRSSDDDESPWVSRSQHPQRYKQADAVTLDLSDDDTPYEKKRSSDLYVPIGTHNEVIEID